ncbi:MAG: LacI family DNA-binding transcriptional regulator [Victivallaceae bacterium]|nr:LacI family DNA-binding transcriptional regulator [Victivallaceae bacterium]
MRKQPTIVDIAKACHVSPATVSRVLYNRPRVAADLRQKIKDEITRSGYVFRHISRNGKILAVMPNASALIHGEYYYELLNALHRHFRPAGYEVIACRSRGLALIGHSNFDAVILLTQDPEGYDFWSKHLVAPLIYVNWETPSQEQNCYSVCADHRGALKNAVERLYRAGHRTIGLLIVGYEMPEAQRIWAEREGFLEAMAQLGLAKQGFVAYTCDQEPHPALTGLLRQRISALICPSITEGGKVARILQNLRLSIPRDLSLIVGDSSFYNQVNAVPLTSLAMPYDAIAENCLAIVCGEKEPLPQPVYPLIERESIAEYQEETSVPF